MLLAIIEIFMMAGTDLVFGILQWTAEFLTCAPIVGKFAIFPHGKACFTDGLPLWKQLRIFGITLI